MKCDTNDERGDVWTRDDGTHKKMFFLRIDINNKHMIHQSCSHEHEHEPWKMR